MVLFMWQDGIIGVAGLYWRMFRKSVLPEVCVSHAQWWRLSSNRRRPRPLYLMLLS